MFRHQRRLRNVVAEQVSDPQRHIPTPQRQIPTHSDHFPIRTRNRCGDRCASPRNDVAPTVADEHLGRRAEVLGSLREGHWARRAEDLLGLKLLLLMRFGPESSLGHPQPCQTQLFGRPRESGAYTSKTFRNIAHFGEFKGRRFRPPQTQLFQRCISLVFFPCDLSYGADLNFWGLPSIFDRPPSRKWRLYIKNV